MKTIITILITVILGLGYYIFAYNTTKYYDQSGLISQPIKVFTGTVSPNTSNGYSIDISGAGFSSISSVAVNALLNTGTVASMPLVVVKSVSTSAVVVNILTQNNATVTILGINVLSGAPLQFAASTSGIVLHVQVIGN